MLTLLLGALLTAFAAASAAGAQPLPVRLATQNAGDELQARPAVVSYTGDGTAYLAGHATSPHHLDSGGLRWVSWRRDSGFAHGFAWLNNCRPDCARGRFHPFRATVRVRRPRHGLFTRMTIKVHIHGRHFFDHRALGYSPPSEYGNEYFPGAYYWKICGNRYTSPC